MLERERENLRFRKENENSVKQQKSKGIYAFRGRDIPTVFIDIDTLILILLKGHAATNILLKVRPLL
jgi:hypothetical protein